MCEQRGRTERDRERERERERERARGRETVIEREESYRVPQRDGKTVQPPTRSLTVRVAMTMVVE